MTYSIRCACGNVCQVRSSQAGTRVECKCGLNIGVPSLRKLQELGRDGVCPAEVQPVQRSNSGKMRVRMALLNQPGGRISSSALFSYSEAVIKAVAAWSESATGYPEVVGRELQIALALVPTAEPLLEIQAHPAIEPAEYVRALADGIRGVEVPRVVDGPVAFAVWIQLRGGCSVSTEFSRPFVRCHATGWPLDVALSREAGVAVAMPPGPSWRARAIMACKRYLRFSTLGVPKDSGASAQNVLVSADGPFHGGDAEHVAAWLYEADMNQLKRLATEHRKFAPLQEILVRRLLDASRADEALQAASQLLTLRPRDAGSFELRAAAYRLSDQTQASLNDYSRALELDPNRGECWRERGRILLELGGNEAAESDFSKALETQQLEPNGWLDRACARIAIGKHALALEDINVSIALNPHSPSGYAMRAQLRLMQAGSNEELESVIVDLGRIQQIDAESAWALVKRADVYCRLNKFQLAIEDCTRALEIQPRDALAHGVRGFAAQQLEDLSTALEDCTRAIELGLKSPLVFLSRAVCWQAREKVDAALADCDSALDIAPEFAPAYNFRGLLHAGEGNLDGALEDFDRAARLAPQWHTPLLYVAGLKQLCDEPESALRACNRAIELQPNDADARIRRAQILQGMGRPEDALEDLNEAIRRDSECVDAYIYRAGLRLHRAEYQETLTDLNVAAELLPTNPTIYHLRAITLMNLNRTDEAIRDFNHLVQMLPDSPGALLLRSEAWYQLGRRGEADRDVEEAMRLAPEKSSELQQQQLLVEASAAHRADDYATSISKATELLDIEPDHEAALHIRAASYWYSEQFVEALDDYNRLIELNSDGEEALPLLNGRGQVHAELGEFEQALDDLNRSIDHAKRTQDKLALAYSLNGRGFAHTGLGQYDQAEQDFDASMILCPENGWLHYNIGLLRLAQGRSLDARDSFSRAVEAVNPSLTPRKKRKSLHFLQRGSNE